MAHLHFIEAKFLGPTNYRGSRVRLVSARFQDSLTFSYDHEYRDTNENAITKLMEIGYTIVATFETKDGCGFLVEEFVGLSEGHRAVAAWKEKN